MKAVIVIFFFWVLLSCQSEYVAETYECNPVYFDSTFMAMHAPGYFFYLKKGLKDGKYKINCVYEDSIYYVVNYKNGLLNDSVKYYYKNHILRARGYYRNHQKHGSWIWYTRRGQLEAIDIYKNDEKVQMVEFDEEGFVKKYREY